jgi:uncharacterized membrane protein
MGKRGQSLGEVKGTGSRRLKESLVLIGLIALGLGLRLFRVGANSYWLDEATSLGIAKLSLGDIVRNAGASSHPPLYYLFLHFWIKLGTTEVAVRGLSTLWGVCLIPAIYALGRQLFNRCTGLVAALLITIAPFFVYYAQEARMYTQLALLTAMAQIFFWKALQKGHRNLWIAFTALMILGAYTHYFTFLVLGFLNLLLLFYRRRHPGRLRQLIVSDLFICICFLPQVSIFMRESRLVLTSFWLKVPHPLQVLTSYLFFTLGYSVPPWLMPIALFVLLSVVALVGYQGVKITLRGEAEAEKWVWLLLLSFGPPVVVYLFSLLKPIYLARTLIIVTPTLYLLLAHGVARLQKFSLLHLLYGLTLVTMGIALHQYYLNPEYARPPMREAAAYLNRHFEAGDVSIHTSDGSYIVFLQYEQPQESYLLLGDPDPRKPVPVYHLFGGQTGELEEIVAGHRRAWLVVALEHSVDYQLQIKSEMDRRFPLLRSVDVRGIEVYLYDLG